MANEMIIHDDRAAIVKAYHRFKGAPVPSAEMPAFGLVNNAERAKALSLLFSAQQDREALKDRYHTLLRQLDAFEEAWDFFFKPQLEAYAAENLPKGKKSLTLLDAGVLSFRKVPERITVVDESKLAEEFKKSVITVSADLDKVKAHYKDTGDIPDGTKVIPARKSFSVKEA
jgi:hypothetical protein